jgi:sugar transferase (PEP-CTERM system associated)/polysaccharide deacetylase family protein (PEP-CTERM system associated)
MIRILDRYFPSRLFVMLFAELLLIVLGVWASVSLSIGSVHLSLLAHPLLLGKALLVTGVCQLCFYFNDLYNLPSIRSHWQLLVRLLKALGLACFLLAFIYWVFPEARFGTGIVEALVFACTLIILTWRVALDWLERVYGREERLLIVGSGAIAQALLRQLRGRTDLPLRVIGFVSENPDEEELPGFPSVPHLGPVSRLGEILRESRPDRVVTSLQERRHRMPAESLLTALVRGVWVDDACELYERLAGKVPVDIIRPSHLVFSGGFRKSAAIRFYKRFFGFVGAFLGLTVVSPLMALIAIAIKIDSSGPVFYRQPRVGLGGHIFEVVKFRSMCADAESQGGPKWVEERDPRVTRLGRVLRHLHLDELPQLINVLWGEMDFIGPRPERPHFVERLRPQIDFYDVRHAVRPGVTGWAQVSLSYPRTVEEAREKLKYDLFYIKNMSVSLDLLILVRTLKFVLFGLRTLPSDERRTQIELIARTPSLPAMNAALHDAVPAALTVDVEDYFQVAAFRRVVRYDDWDRMESRVEQNTQRALDLLAESNARGTFFVLGWVAERFPGLVRQIHAAGHELGCHSYAHRLVYDLSSDEFLDDTRRALAAIEDAAGVSVRAYRAPSFSITPRSLWALDILAELGLQLDCSIFPIHHDLYGFPSAPRQPFRIRVNGSTLLEFPPPTLRIGRWNVAVTGGGYLRQLPVAYQLRALKVLERRREAIQLYFHPWELDPDQPRIAGSVLSRLRHYRNLDRTSDRLRRLLALFPFGTVSEAVRHAAVVSEVEFAGSSATPTPVGAVEIHGVPNAL